MATQLESRELDLQEQLVRIRRAIEESDKFSAETRKLVADMQKANADVRYQPWLLLAQGLIAGAALMGAGAAIAKLFFP